MLLGDVVNVFIGLAMTFAALALVVSALTEAISSLLKWRAHCLLSGLKLLLNDPKLEGLAGDLLNHAAISPLGSGSDVKSATSYSNRPSYIPAAQFASALIDILQRPPGAPALNLSLKAAIATQVTNPQLRRLLQGFLERTGENVDAFEARVASWFDSSMDRLSGSYKRHTQVVSFVLGLAIAAGFNVNSFSMTEVMWRHPAMIQQAQLVKPDMTPETAVGILLKNDFPFGWNTGGKGLVDTVQDAPFETIFGLLVTAIALLFGAPFWFDLLGKAVQLRGTGPAPTTPARPSE